MAAQDSIPSTDEQSEAPLLTLNEHMLSSMRIKVKLYTIIQIGVSLMFWIWALVNILKDGEFDAGVVSFVFPFFAGICGYVSTSKSYEKMLFVNLHLGLTVAGHFLVTLNYLGGALISGVSMGFRIYCIIFTGLWFISWVLFGIWAWQWRKISKQSAKFNM
eukprot:UN01233